jgi:hypothetical protein
MERSTASPKRPWYLLVAIVFAWLFGVGGCTQGTAIIGSYWSPAQDVSEIANRAKTEEDRSKLKEAASRCYAATERSKTRIFPLGVASFVLGAAMVILAARSMAGRGSARALLVQVVLAQALFVIVRDFSTRDVLAECVDFERQQVRLDLVERNADPSIIDRVTPELRAKANLAGTVIRCAAAGLIVLALTRRRTREYYEALERRRAEGA